MGLEITKIKALNCNYFDHKDFINAFDNAMHEHVYITQIDNH